MSVFASRTTKTVDIPFDPPHTVTLQKLSGRHLGKARQVFLSELFAEVQERGGAKVQKDMQELFKDNTATEKAVEAAKADPLNGFDKLTLVRHGVKAWSYQDVKVTPETIDDLDDDAVDFFATEILRLTKPSLFQSKEEAKAAQREAQGASPRA